MSTVPRRQFFGPEWRAPMFVALAALLLRFFLLWLSHFHEDPAHLRFATVGLEANFVADSLASGNGFFRPFPGYEAITAWLAPVYPFLWAIGNKLFHLKGFGSVLYAQSMNCVFSAATCLPIYGIGKKIFGRTVGLASAWCWTFLPYAVLFPIEWTWDQSLSALVLGTIVYATLRMAEASSSMAWMGYGLLWAFAALVNPTMCILMPFLLGWAMIRHAQPWRRSLADAAKVLGIFVLALMPWTIRNYYAVDGLIFVKSNFGLELWLGNNPAVTQIYTPELHPASDFRQRIILILEGEPNYNREKQRQAIAYIRKNPRAFLRNTGARIADTWLATFDSNVEPWIFHEGLSHADVWFTGAFSIFSFAGLILALRFNRNESLPLALCLVLFPIPYYVTHTALRYRHPIDPFLTILTVYAVAQIVRAFSPKPAAENSTMQLPREYHA